MCVRKCDCNNCLKNKTCTDCVHTKEFENKEINCRKNGIQNCPYRKQRR